jgi:hypothetical protein
MKNESFDLDRAVENIHLMNEMAASAKFWFTTWTDRGMAATPENAQAIVGELATIYKYLRVPPGNREFIKAFESARDKGLLTWKEGYEPAAPPKPAKPAAPKVEAQTFRWTRREIQTMPDFDFKKNSCNPEFEAAVAHYFPETAPLLTVDFDSSVVPKKK